MAALSTDTLPSGRKQEFFLHELSGCRGMSDYISSLTAKAKVCLKGHSSQHLNINTRFYAQRESLIQNFLDLQVIFFILLSFSPS